MYKHICILQFKHNIMEYKITYADGIYMYGGI